MSEETQIPKFPYSVSLAIPLYNNRHTFEAPLKECKEILSKYASKYEIIICDDSSTDGSTDVLKKLAAKDTSLRLFVHLKNEGIAPTIKFLYQKARKEIIVLFSLDGDWNPHDIKNLLLAISEKDADIVIGKRNKTDYTYYRRLISHFYNSLSYLLFGVRTVDAGSIKAFKRAVFISAKPKANSLFFEAEMIIKAVQKGSKMVSIPVMYKKRQKISGSAGNWKNVVNSFLDLLKLRLSI